jgi:hypothetical protein
MTGAQPDMVESLLTKLPVKLAGNLSAGEANMQTGAYENLGARVQVRGVAK